jgi:WAHD domain of WASH complex
MDIGIKERQKIRQSSGRLAQTNISLVSYEMY